MSAVFHQQLAAWLYPCRNENEPVDLGMLKSTLSMRGVNGRGWRLFLEYGDVLFEPLGRPWVHPTMVFSSGRNAVTWLQLLQACEMDVLPPSELVASIADWPLPNQRLTEIPPLYLRAAWKGAVAAQYQGRGLDAFVRDEVLPVSEWLFGNGLHIDPDPALMKAGWSTLFNRAMAIRKVPVAMSAPAETGSVLYEWDPYICRIEWGGYVFIGLTTTAALKEEGKTMQHCVGDYDENCRDGICRIYSVREKKTGLRVATCSLECTADGDDLNWELDQVKGVRNAEVPRQVVVAADAVLRSYLDLPQERFQRPKPRGRITFDDLDDDIPF